MNPYEVLGVERNAKEETIKTAYRKLARNWHPDLFHTAEEISIAEEKMKELNAAWELIGTPEKRVLFDASNPVSVNVYEYYASKKTSKKKHWGKKSSSADIENEKQKRAVLQFLNLEYDRKNEIFDMFSELATGAYNNAFSSEEYTEMLNLVLEELQDCISRIEEIVSVAKSKKIQGLEFDYEKAQQTIEELSYKASETPTTLDAAFYAEETKILTIKVNDLMNGFRDRILAAQSFDILSMTWEFDNDIHLNTVRNNHVNEVSKLLTDMEWVQKTSSERHIEIGRIPLENINGNFFVENFTLIDCIKIVKKLKEVSSFNLQQLREEFWKKMCTFSTDSKGNSILQKVIYDAKDCRGNFICPSYISGIKKDAFYWLQNMSSLTIPARLIRHNIQIKLCYDHSFSKLIFTYDNHSQIVDVSKIKYEIISSAGNYICVSPDVFSKPTFALVDKDNIYVYDEEKLCQLNGVNNTAELEELSSSWRYNWDGYQLQIHTWAQVAQKLPDPKLMSNLPTSVEFVRKWLNMNTTNFDNALSASENSSSLRERIVRLYIGLGALNGDYCLNQAEWIISQLNLTKLYRSRLERFPNENQKKQDLMFSVPKSAVDFVQRNITNKEFHPYVFAFLEGYNFFIGEAKKSGVELSAQFVIETAPQYVFHGKANHINKNFVQQLFEGEKNIEPKIADKILHLYSLSEREYKKGTRKMILETEDFSSVSGLRYRYLNLDSLQSYIPFTNSFREKNSTYYRIEAENVFTLSNTHAIEIINGENRRVAIVILNLLNEGELFADIMDCKYDDKSIDVIEAIKRSLIDQKNINNMVTGISIGTNEDPNTTDSGWRSKLRYSKSDWANEVEWIKFEYLFENPLLGTSYKGYRVRFKVDGELQTLARPNPHNKGFYGRYR